MSLFMTLKYTEYARELPRVINFNFDGNLSALTSIRIDTFLIYAISAQNSLQIFCYNLHSQYL